MTVMMSSNTCLKTLLSGWVWLSLLISLSAGQSGAPATWTNKDVLSWLSSLGVSDENLKQFDDSQGHGGLTGNDLFGGHWMEEDFDDYEFGLRSRKRAVVNAWQEIMNSSDNEADSSNNSIDEKVESIKSDEIEIEKEKEKEIESDSINELKLSAINKNITNTSKITNSTLLGLSKFDKYNLNSSIKTNETKLFKTISMLNGTNSSNSNSKLVSRLDKLSSSGGKNETSKLLNLTKEHSSDIFEGMNGDKFSNGEILQKSQSYNVTIDKYLNATRSKNATINFMKYNNKSALLKNEDIFGKFSPKDAVRIDVNAKNDLFSKELLNQTNATTKKLIYEKSGLFDKPLGAGTNSLTNTSSKLDKYSNLGESDLNYDLVEKSLLNVSKELKDPKYSQDFKDLSSDLLDSKKSSASGSADISTVEKDEIALAKEQEESDNDESQDEGEAASNGEENADKGAEGADAAEGSQDSALPQMPDFETFEKMQDVDAQQGESDVSDVSDVSDASGASDLSALSGVSDFDNSDMDDVDAAGANIVKTVGDTSDTPGEAEAMPQDDVYDQMSKLEMDYEGEGSENGLTKDVSSRSSDLSGVSGVSGDASDLSGLSGLSGDKSNVGLDGLDGLDGVSGVSGLNTYDNGLGAPPAQGLDRNTPPLNTVDIVDQIGREDNLDDVAPGDRPVSMDNIEDLDNVDNLNNFDSASNGLNELDGMGQLDQVNQFGDVSDDRTGNAFSTFSDDQNEDNLEQLKEADNSRDDALAGQQMESMDSMNTMNSMVGLDGMGGVSQDGGSNDPDMGDFRESDGDTSDITDDITDDTSDTIDTNENVNDAMNSMDDTNDYKYRNQLRQELKVKISDVSEGDPKFETIKKVVFDIDDSTQSDEARYYQVKWNVTENGGHTATRTFTLNEPVAITVLTDLKYNFFVSTMSGDDNPLGSWETKDYTVPVPDHQFDAKSSFIEMIIKLPESSELSKGSFLGMNDINIDKWKFDKREFNTFRLVSENVSDEEKKLAERVRSVLLGLGASSVDVSQVAGGEESTLARGDDESSGISAGYVLVVMVLIIGMAIMGVKYFNKNNPNESFFSKLLGLKDTLQSHMGSSQVNDLELGSGLKNGRHGKKNSGPSGFGVQKKSLLNGDDDTDDENINMDDDEDDGMSNGFGALKKKWQQMRRKETSHHTSGGKGSSSRNDRTAGSWNNDSFGMKKKDKNGKDSKDGMNINNINNMKSEPTAEEFVRGVFEEMGIPAFQQKEQIRKLKDIYISSMQQLNELDDRDWKRLGFNETVVTNIKEKLERTIENDNDNDNINENDEDSWSDDGFESLTDKDDDKKKSNKSKNKNKTISTTSRQTAKDNTNAKSVNKDKESDPFDLGLDFDASDKFSGSNGNNASNSTSEKKKRSESFGFGDVSDFDDISD